MTDVTTVQPRAGGTDGPPDPKDPADPADAIVGALVPPPRPRWRSALYALVFVALLTGLVVGTVAGVFTAHLDAQATEWGRDPATHGAYIVLTLTNGRRFPARIDRIDASGPGLHVRSVVVDGERLPLTLRGHEHVQVRIEYRVVNCAHIDRDHDLVVTTRRGLWTRTTAVHVDGFTDAPDGIRSYSGRDPYAVGYQYGITRESCATAR